MKKVILMMVVLSWALLAGAQYQKNVIKADIPFDFVVGSQVMPAGVYNFTWSAARKISIDPKEWSGSHGYALISELDIFYKGTETSVVFEQVGNRYFLTEIRHPGEARVVTLPNKGAEAQMKMAKKQVQVTGEEVGK